MSAKWPSSVATDADLYVAVNSLQTTLSTALGTSDTSVVLASATGFPVAGGVTIGNEVIFYTGVSGATLTGCTRGADGTTAASHSVGVPVGAAIIAFHHNGLMAEIEAIESYLDTVLGKGTAVTATEFGYVHGVTSAIQTQMNLKAALAGPTFTGTVTIPTPFTIGAVSMTATGTELNFVAGVTSAIQTQLNAKLGTGGGTLTGALTINPATSQLILGGVSSGKKVTITAPAPATADRVWTIPDITADGTFAALEGTQTFSGGKTFSSAVTINPATNQLILGVTRTVTITAPTPASNSRVVTLPDLSADYSVVGTAGTQTIAGAKTFSSAIVVGGNTTSDANFGTISSVSLGNYYEGTFPATFTGPFNSGALTINYTRIGRNVTLVVPSFSGSSSSAATFSASAAIPSSLRPTTTQFFFVQIKDNSVAPTAPGLISVSSAGTITIFKSDAANSFTASGTAGIDLTTTFTYTMV